MCILKSTFLIESFEKQKKDDWRLRFDLVLEDLVIFVVS